MSLTPSGHALADAIDKYTTALTYAEAAAGRTGMQHSMTHAGQLEKLLGPSWASCYAAQAARDRSAGLPAATWHPSRAAWLQSDGGLVEMAKCPACGLSWGMTLPCTRPDTPA